MIRAERWALAAVAAAALTAVLVLSLDLARPVVKVEMSGWPTPVPTQPPAPIFNLPTYLLGQRIDTQESIGADYQDGSDAFTDTEMVVQSNDAGVVHVPRCIQLQGAPDTRYAVGVPATHSVTEIVIGGTNRVSAWTEQTTQLSVDGTGYKLWVNTAAIDCTGAEGAPWRIRAR